MPDPVVIASLVGAGATIAAATAQPLISQYSERRRMYVSKRADVIEGLWEGTGTDFYVEGGGQSYSFRLNLIFRRTHRKVEADCDISSAEHPGINTVLVLSGGFYNDDLLQFTYRSKDPSRKQVGVAVLELSDGGRELNGHFAGFSPTRSVFAAGRLALHKRPT